MFAVFDTVVCETCNFECKILGEDGNINCTCRYLANYQNVFLSHDFL